MSEYQTQRALANSPPMILADEPTASLDTDRGLSVMRMLRKVSTDQGTAILVVTHDQRMIGEVDRVLQLVDGAVTSDESHSKNQSEGRDEGSSEHGRTGGDIAQGLSAE